MRRLLPLLALPLAFAVPAPSHAATHCSSVGTDGTVAGDRTVRRQCLNWSGSFICTHSSPGAAEVKVVVVVCVPSA